ncbi:MAG: hypothetical protein QG612_1603 [Pseudomonadota bacterium]|nr:hypothetical protein [Pseudomonadota bacterium]
MRIVTWNCGGALRRKRAALAALDADVLVIQECENPAVSTDRDYRDWADRHAGLWTGQSRHKGLAVWTKPSPSDAYGYIGQLWQWLRRYPDFLAQERALLLGDLNSNAIWDRQHRGCSHSDVVRMLQAWGLHSLYHRNQGESHGQERTPTFFLHRNPARPYHIDYAFLSASLLEGARIEIGPPTDWLALSDHMPVVVALAGSR